MNRDRSMDIAVIGMSARFPGLKTIEQWWSALIKGEVLTTRYEHSVLIESGISEGLVNDPQYVPVHGHLDDADRFDNRFFKISARDAELMDPQHRLMLEASWNALEDAGCVGAKNQSRTGVFASGSGSGYFRSMLSNGALDYDTLEQALHGTEPDFIASLIAYKLDLRGPAISVQTACSSSLVSLHIAVQSLLNGDCDQALVVAAGIAFPQAGHLYQPGGIKSASGNCRPFDWRSDGVVEGSGVACLVLRRFEDCMTDAPELHGVILGTAINNDGAMKAGYFAPSVDGQSEVILSAVRNAGIDALSIGYLETHGTGTRIGDPIEWTAASGAYKSLGAYPGQIAIGALKANIGHLDAAAGLASIIKSMRVVKEGIIPPLSGFEELNPFLEIDSTPLFVPKQKIEWNSLESRRAAISAFGIGGTNAHVIIEEPPRSRRQINIEKTTIDQKAQIFVVSAADAEALKNSRDLLKEYLYKKQPDIADVAYTLSHARAVFSERFIVCGRTAIEIVEAIEKSVGIISGISPVEGPEATIFLFPGQGSQHPGMALPFIATMPKFFEILERCLSAFDNATADKLREALLNPLFPEEELNETSLAQPTLFVFEYAIAKTLIEIGVTPTALLGHSLGEITAACISGVLDFYDAAKFVVTRGSSMQQCPEGAMLALNCSLHELQELLKKSKFNLYVAAHNTYESHVVSGEVNDVEAFHRSLDDGIISKRLKANRAFHSPFIEPALDEMKKVLEKIKFGTLKCAMALNTTGELVKVGETVLKELFLNQARDPVQFAQGLNTLRKNFPGATVVEIGYGKTLSSMAAGMDFKIVTLTESIGIRKDQECSILRGIGTLWTLGHPITISELCLNGKIIHLPTYPFFGPKWMAPEAAAGLKTSSTVINEKSLVTDNSYTKIQDNLQQCVYAELAKVWAELLNYESLEESSNFFDLGGDSLLMITLIRKINKAFGIQTSPRAMLSAQTLGSQIKIICEMLKSLDENKLDKNLVVNG